MRRHPAGPAYDVLCEKPIWARQGEGADESMRVKRSESRERMEIYGFSDESESCFLKRAHKEYRLLCRETPDSSREAQ